VTGARTLATGISRKGGTPAKQGIFFQARGAPYPGFLDIDPLIEEEVMAGHYHHTQPGTVLLTALSLAALLSGLPILAMTLRSGHWPWLLFVPFAL
jgi:hypothetical protein